MKTRTVMGMGMTERVWFHGIEGCACRMSVLFILCDIISRLNECVRCWKDVGG